MGLQYNVHCAYFDSVKSKVKLMELPLCTDISLYRNGSLYEHHQNGRAATGEPRLSWSMGSLVNVLHRSELDVYINVYYIVYQVTFATSWQAWQVISRTKSLSPANLLACAGSGPGSE